MNGAASHNWRMLYATGTNIRSAEGEARVELCERPLAEHYNTNAWPILFFVARENC